MSLYSILGIILLLFMLVFGSCAKLWFCKRRKNLDGFHGYLFKNTPNASLTDKWESVSEKSSR